MALTDTQLLPLGYGAAFAVALAVVVLDCHQSVQKAVGRVPVNVLKSYPAWFLAVGCGLLSTICFHFSNGSLFNGILQLQQISNPIGRGALVGLGFLTIIRSKLFNIKENAFGGEYFYTLCRQVVVDSVWYRWRGSKRKFTTDACLFKACSRPTFENELHAEIIQVIYAKSEEVKKAVELEWANAVKSRPKSVMDCNDPEWLSYFKTLINLALDSAGERVVSDFPFLIEDKSNASLSVSVKTSPGDTPQTKPDDTLAP